MGQGGAEGAVDYPFLYGKGNEDHQLRTGCFTCKRILSIVRRLEFIGVGMSQAWQCRSECILLLLLLLLLLFDMDVSCHRPFLPGTSLEPAVIPTAQASSFTLHYFPYYV